MKSSRPITGYLPHASNFLPVLVFLFGNRLGSEQPDLRWTHALPAGGARARVRDACPIDRAAHGSIAVGDDLLP